MPAQLVVPSSHSHNHGSAEKHDHDGLDDHILADLDMTFGLDEGIELFSPLATPNSSLHPPSNHSQFRSDPDEKKLSSHSENVPMSFSFQQSLAMDILSPYSPDSVMGSSNSEYGGLNYAFPSEDMSAFYNQTHSQTDQLEYQYNHQSSSFSSNPYTGMLPSMNSTMIHPHPPAIPVHDKPITFKKGKPCAVFGCLRRAQSNNKCKGHGGGARCQYAGCSRSSQGGGLCRTHGGGKRCKVQYCNKGTQRNGLCFFHGGIRRCGAEGCEKKDRGNGFCIGHGGGKKCSVEQCERLVRKGTLCQIHMTAEYPGNPDADY